MRICHFEDLIFENNIDINKIIANIVEKKYPVSIKWDGSPAFVAGMDDKGFFLAFKNGYLKKTPELFRKFEEISKAITDPDLMRIMSMLFITFQEIKFPGVLQGDFLFDMYHINNGRFTPNVVPYQLHPLERVQRDYALGVAVHTVNGKMARFTTDVVNALFVDTMPKITYSANLIRANDAQGLTNVEKEMFKKYVNSRVRKGRFDLNLGDFWTFAPDNKKAHIVTNQGNWSYLISTYMALARWKNDLLSTVQSVNIVSPVKGHQHEGLVIDTGDKLIKMVDRIKFSTLNFNKDRTHGRESVS